ncbi:hypothetical protein BKH46_04865 [Helicobacter sp. 12S02634-8]|uniref:AAC(3) family N-acetyltransferase n=1 Tax=Helicobacter sp. 12S02634-8 TaxID=1476199 RepID=UPI000BD2A893|nr:AAC(3) family N-acetyltransferase [Helicobacter sp. 12S02634-8]PAF47055.1 hypothetical protein BKH46_04865 [Helicobacter sp. 12S02634-8]
MEDKNLILFTHQNTPITKSDLLQALRDIQAHQCDYLFIHSELSFGLPSEFLSKKELLSHLMDIFFSLGVPHLIVPTFSFSFCAKEDFNPQSTPSPMGILSEYFRKLPNAKRTLDPLMSCAYIGNDLGLCDISKHSCGAGSLFDKLHSRKDVKFLFFGNQVHQCFTYSHYIERALEVPYRYDKAFSGNIITQNKSYQDTFILPVRYANVFAFEDDTLSQRLSSTITKTRIGKSPIEIISEKEAYHMIVDAISQNIDFMLKAPYPRDFLDPTYTYGKKVAL